MLRPVSVALLLAAAPTLAVTAVPGCGSGDGPTGSGGSAQGGHAGQGGHSTHVDGGGGSGGSSSRDGGGGSGGCANPPDAGPPAVGACALDIPIPKKTAPIVDVKADFDAKGDGVTDDTAAIQAAIDSLSGGGTVVFPAGTYLYGGADGSGSSKVIHVSPDGVSLFSDAGAELRSVNADAQEISLEGKRTSLYGLHVTSPQFERKDAPNNHRVVLRRTGHEVVDNHIDGGAAAGIFVYGADHFLIARNVVENTEADSIHMTQGPNGPSHDGRVLQNTVRAPGPYWGDDLVAVIGYRDAMDDPDVFTNANHELLIECNDLGDAGWGNGVDIGGGKDITVRRNKISGIHHAGGIKLGTEASYPTYSTLNVLVEDNTIDATQTDGTTKDGTRTSFGGIEIAARDPGTSVKKVLVKGAHLDGAANNGIRFQGILCDLGFDGLTMTAIAHGAFGNQGTPTIAGGCVIGCKDITLDGTAATSPICTGSTLPTGVTGSSIPDPGPARTGCGK